MCPTLVIPRSCRKERGAEQLGRTSPQLLLAGERGTRLQSLLPMLSLTEKGLAWSPQSSGKHVLVPTCGRGRGAVDPALGRWTEMRKLWGPGPTPSPPSSPFMQAKQML